MVLEEFKANKYIYTWVCLNKFISKNYWVLRNHAEFWIEEVDINCRYGQYFQCCL